MTSPISAIPIVAVASGKGGVGKSSVALALARALTDSGVRVGLVDADLSGPDIPRMVGLRRDVPTASLRIADFGPHRTDLEAIEVDGVEIVSAGFMMAGTQAFTAGEGIADMLLARLITRTRWNRREILLVDLPPGTTGVGHALRIAGRLAVLLVVTPAEVSHLDSHRLTTVLNHLKVPVLGGVENMAYLSCPDCTHRIELHPPTPADRTIWHRGIGKLASLPYRPGALPTIADLAPVTTVVRDYLARDN
ncbi:P-loop NTPase [Nocardia sp. NPDC052316]|uniref:P-loop NTPase n=1 Tax=Nocardia sp. NPDC052316 TaxID=3364329 RepID=UPI0037C6AA0C